MGGGGSKEHIKYVKDLAASARKGEGFSQSCQNVVGGINLDEPSKLGKGPAAASLIDLCKTMRPSSKSAPHQPASPLLR